MIGAIIGDIVGSRFEFDNLKSKEFELFTEEDDFTDDSVLTIACMDFLLHSKHTNADAIYYIKKWADKCPCVTGGYGARFVNWLNTNGSKPYNSCGNGSAMRISPVGFYAQTEEEVKILSKSFTEVTHNHPEGLKGAEVTAMCIYYLRHGKDKNYIKEYVTNAYPEVMSSLTYEDLLKYYKFESLCQQSVPQAIYSFLISDSFEDCIRTAVSIGGDTDTICAIAGGLASAYYGTPKNIKKTSLVYLRPEMVDIIEEFETTVKNNEK